VICLFMCIYEAWMFCFEIVLEGGGSFVLDGMVECDVNYSMMMT